MHVCVLGFSFCFVDDEPCRPCSGTPQEELKVVSDVASYKKICFKAALVVAYVVVAAQVQCLFWDRNMWIFLEMLLDGSRVTFLQGDF